MSVSIRLRLNLCDGSDLLSAQGGFTSGDCNCFPPPGGLFCGGGGNVSWVRRADGNGTSTTPSGREGFGRHDGSADIVTRLETRWGGRAPLVST
jgi:hypothetical protein